MGDPRKHHAVRHIMLLSICPDTNGQIYSIQVWFHLYRVPRIDTREGNGTPLQYSCLENPMDKGAWWAAVHGVAKSRTRLSNFTFIFHFPLSCTGEGNGNPLQWSCLENPRDGGAWWAAVCGVAQSQTRLKWLSSSSSSSRIDTYKYTEAESWEVTRG